MGTLKKVMSGGGIAAASGIVVALLLKLAVFVIEAIDRLLVSKDIHVNLMDKDMTFRDAFFLDYFPTVGMGALVLWLGGVGFIIGAVAAIRRKS
jgi:hypothetical protein